MQFLSNFVMGALMLQVATLFALALVLGTQAVKNAASAIWQKLSGRTPNHGH